MLELQPSRQYLPAFDTRIRKARGAGDRASVLDGEPDNPRAYRAAPKVRTLGPSGTTEDVSGWFSKSPSLHSSRTGQQHVPDA
jgi:hypothetical protein